MLKQRITMAIKEILDINFGFDIYIVMKGTESLMKRFVLDEGNPNERNGFKERIRESIKESIQRKFLDEDSLYVDENDLANEQNCFYVIKQKEGYRPFSFINTPEEQLENFKFSDKDNADAILFKFTFQQNGEIKQIWAYQKIWPVSIPNKQKKHFQLVTKSDSQPDIFKEMKDQMFIITKRIDLLVIGDEIITDKIEFMEKHLKLEEFLRISATRAVTLITSVGLVKNEDKLLNYVYRSNKKFAKKMMQVHKFPVSTMSKDRLIEKLKTVERWKNIFEIQDEQVYLRNYSDVEKIIDLFTERYTKSEITEQEYDTSVKDKAEPINN